MPRALNSDKPVFYKNNLHPEKGLEQAVPRGE